MTTTHGRILVLTMAAALVACDSDRVPVAPAALSPPAPSPGTPPVPAPVQLAGTVYDAAWRPLAGARVEVVNGPDAGRFVTADSKGGYRLNGAFDETTRFRATKEGHAAADWPLPSSCGQCNPHWWLFFYLESLAPHADLAGDYTLTVIANSACAALPTDARTRSYAATVTRSAASAHAAGSQFVVKVGGATFVDGYSRFTIGVAGDFVKADIGDWGHGGAGLVEEVAPNTYVVISGSIETTVPAADAATISARWSGRSSGAS